MSVPTAVTTGSQGAVDHCPCAHPLTSDRWERLLVHPVPSFIGPLIMLTDHIKIELSVVCLWNREEASWPDAIKHFSVELTYNLEARVKKWRGKGRCAEISTSPRRPHRTLNPSFECVALIDGHLPKSNGLSRPLL